MALITQSIDNLINGVSQQPDTLRLDSQAEYARNVMTSPVEGLTRRPPTRHVAKLAEASEDLTSAFFHTINRDTTERYIVTISNGTLKVHTVEGDERTVITPDGTGYLATGAVADADAFSAVTVADYTFIVNKTTEVQKGSSMSPDRGSEALVYVRAGNYGQQYSVWIDGVKEAEVVTPDGSTASDVNDIRTNTIAADLSSQLQASGNLSGFTITDEGSVIHIVKDDGSPFNVGVVDGNAGNNLRAFREEVQRFSDLPASNVPDGYQLRVVGDNTSSFDDYYVTFERGASNGDTSEGVWKETIAQNIEVGFDTSTMPHVLVRKANGDFEFRAADSSSSIDNWQPRTVGDDESNPFPSFVGRAINDVFFYRNRLGFVAGENVIMSRAGEFFNFFTSTVTALLDSDPIDVAASHTKVSILKYAVPFAERLLLFSDQTQFVLNAGDLLTPATVSISQTTEFEVDTGAKPEAVGRNVYFASPKGDYLGIREFFVDAETLINDAADITSHVPQYIEGPALRIAGASNEDILCVLPRTRSGTLYIYKFFWSGREKLQSSWTEWTFGTPLMPGKILNIAFIMSTLYLVVAYEDGTYIEAMDVSSGAVDPEAGGYQVHMDRKVVLPAGSGSYNPANDTTAFTLPYQAVSPGIGPVAHGTPANVTAFVASGSPTRKEGQIERAKTIGGSFTQVALDGDWSNDRLIFGSAYVSKFGFSTFFIKEGQSGQGQRAVSTGRLQIRTLSVFHEDTGYFELRVKPTARPEFTYTYPARTLQDSTFVLGEVMRESGSFRVPIQSRNHEVNVEVHSDHPLPMRLTGAEWEGFYTRRSRRM